MTLNPMKCRRKNALKMQNDRLIPEFKLYSCTLHHFILMILLNFIKHSVFICPNTV